MKIIHRTNENYEFDLSYHFAYAQDRGEAGGHKSDK